MNTYLKCVAMTLGGLLIAPALFARPPQSSLNHAATDTQHDKPTVCFSAVFSGPLPGKSDYCLGMRDWSNGDYESGLDLLKRAAGWGNKNAQYTLGLIYYGGHHVPTNTALGMAWLMLADERHNDDQISRVRQAAFKWATPSERQQAEQLFQQMEATYGDKVAATKALRRLEHWQRGQGAFDSGCVRVFGAQAAAAERLGLASEPPQSLRRMLRPSHPISMSPDASAARNLKEMRKVRRYRTRFSNANAGVCITIQTQHHVAQKLADKYFAGWLGVVTVGPLKAVPAPASSAQH